MNESTLTDFVREFEPVLGPLLPPLRDCAEALAHTNDHDIEVAVVPIVRDVAHHMGVLLEKVKEQQTFVLVFGPLKSGKSTLMNALAATYVSEVTALPAYPCMVYVSHAPTSSFEITRYDGTSEVLRDAAALEALMNEAHVELARELAAAEDRGDTFDPAVHFPAALRRVDVHLPAEELRSSGAVLVDTPGLYTRMKFGYDAMTRDFRHAAACAVFVVKTDNLFLEQVFAEFEDLLDMFSRIFLVVNVDPGKRDLGPDGELVPSAEAEDPTRIVDAFRTFSMTSRMRAADEEGKLRIHTVDLLRAARRRLRHEPEDEGDPAGLAPMHDDLLDFLSSSEYIVTFISDSLRQGRSLLERLEEALSHRALEEIAEGLERDRGLLEEARERYAALERAASFHWDGVLSDFDRRVEEEAQAGFRATRERAAKAQEQSLDEWFAGEESLRDLVHTRANAGLAAQLRASEEVVRRAMARVSGARAAGLELPAEVSNDLERVGLRPESLPPALPSERVAGPAGSNASFDFDAIPVRKKVWDWFLFRGAKTIRRRLFGDPAEPTLEVAAELKEARLGEAGREHLSRSLAARANAVAPRQEKAALEALLGAHRDAYLRGVRAALAERRPRLETQVATLEERVTLAEGVVLPVRALRREALRTGTALDDLHDRFFPPEPTVVLLPAEPPATAEEASAEGEAAPAERALEEKSAEPAEGN